MARVVRRHQRINLGSELGEDVWVDGEGVEHVGEGGCGGVDAGDPKP